MKVIVGATGCVGSRLAKRLAKKGEPVRALVRRPDAVLPAGVEAVRGDLLDPASLGPLVRGASVVYFLAHAMGKQPRGGLDLESEDRAQAKNVLEAARREGVTPRIVYVSGLGASSDAKSAHLRGRWAVEDELARSGFPFVIFRAGVLLGPGSVGFEFLLRYVRSPVMPLPSWTQIVMQPFALADLLDALERAGNEAAFVGRTIDLGTKDRPTYAEYFARTAKAMGYEPITIPVPFDLASAAPLAVAVGGEVPLREGMALAESLVTSPFLVSDGGAAMRELGIPERSLEDALRLGLRDAVAERV